MVVVVVVVVSGCSNSSRSSSNCSTSSSRSHRSRSSRSSRRRGSSSRSLSNNNNNNNNKKKNSNNNRTNNSNKKASKQINSNEKLTISFVILFFLTDGRNEKAHARTRTYARTHIFPQAFYIPNIKIIMIYFYLQLFQNVIFAKETAKFFLLVNSKEYLTYKDVD